MSSDLESRIRERAYEIWENEGRPHGRSHDHWTQARAEFVEARSEINAAPETATAARPRKARAGSAEAGPAKKAPARASSTTAKKRPAGRSAKPS